MERKIECINFDLDSVLYIPSDFLEATLLMTIRAMTETGLKASPKKALKKLKEIRAIDPNAKDHFDQLCLHFNGSSDPLIVAAGIEKYWDCKIGMMTSAPETKLTLRSLYEKYPLAIVSNGPPLKQAGKIVRLGLSHFFSRYDARLKVQNHLFYATSEKRKMKPYPYLWLKSKKAIDYKFPRALMVGDRLWEDVFGARRLGMIAIRVNQGPHSHETVKKAFENASERKAEISFFLKRHTKEEILELMEPDYSITSLGELEKTVSRIEKNLA
ncbi:MAG: HAD family hydrolase [Proteobacteria bacterium]|nr:HAD family hydrolase [Pseudomonadota bacterium]